MNIKETIKRIYESQIDEISLFKLSIEALECNDLTKEEKTFFNDIRETTRFSAMLGSSVGFNYSLLKEDARRLLSR